MTLHTLPHTEKTVSHDGEQNKDIKPHQMHTSTTLIPRLISVAEIIKREYVKKLDSTLAEKGCLSGLHQYNELGTLEERDEGAGKVLSEEDRHRLLANALQGRNQ